MRTILGTNTQRVTVVGVALALLSISATPALAGKSSSTTRLAAASTNSNPWTSVRLVSPARTEVRNGNGSLLATLTDGSRSVVLTGPARTLSESGTTLSVTTASWVRLLPSPFTGVIDQPWLEAALADRSPDILAVALEYVTGAKTRRASDGALVSADATYGPLVDGVRQEGSDWNDFLQVKASYDGITDSPETAQAGALDCSGFVRMVFGRRLGIPMALASDRVRLPRRATQMHTDGPGTLLANSTTQITDMSLLLAGDLVLFDASGDDGTAIDHVGIYLGLDSVGHPRFVSSRKKADGPTLGDTGGRSTLNGSGLYATSLRAVRRL